MSSESEPTKKEHVFGPCVTASEASLMVLLSVLIRYSRGYAFTEEELMEKTHLNREDVMKWIALLEQEGFIKSSLEKPSGDQWQRLYSFANDVDIKIILECSV